MHIRPASAVDARSLSELLNEIIALGGTTALKTLTKADMISWIVSNPAQYAFLMAEDERGDALGFQAIGPRKSLPPRSLRYRNIHALWKGPTGHWIGPFQRHRKES